MNRSRAEFGDLIRFKKEPLLFVEVTDLERRKG